MVLVMDLEIVEDRFNRKQVINYTLGMLLRQLPKDRGGDRIFAHARFVAAHGRPPTNEMMFNDFLHRFKQSAEILNPLRVLTTDKALAKLFVRQIAGDRFVVPTLAVLNSDRQIDEYEFTPSTCIKPTHMSGKVVFPNDGGNVDREELKDWLRQNYYLYNREINYMNLIPKIIVEPLLFENTNLNDYKIFCYRGIPKLIQVDMDRRAVHARVYFDPSWTDTLIRLQFPHYEGQIDRPKPLGEMLGLAAKLAAPFELVRIDLFCEGERIYVGEITHCHGGACEGFPSQNDEIRMSKLIFG